MIIFLHGDDTFRSREKLRELKQKFLREVDPSGANLVTIDGTTANASDIWAAIAAQSFLVRKRMVVVERIGEPRATAVRADVAVWLERVPEDVILVFWESKSRQKTEDRRQKSTKTAKARGKKTPSSLEKGDPLFPLLLAEKYAQEFTPLAGAELAAWVRARVGARDATIAPDALRALTAEVGSDLWRMHAEIEKLAAAALGDPTPSRSPSQREGEKNKSFPTSLRERFSPCLQQGEREGVRAKREGRRGGVGDDEERGMTITLAHVRDLVTAGPTDSIFAFTDAIGTGDRVAAFRALRALEAARVDPQYLLTMLTRQFRLLVSAADLLARGTHPTTLAAELKIAPFVAQKLAQQARHASVARLRDAFLALAALDHRLKSSRAPWQALVDLFMLETTTPTR